MKNFKFKVDNRPYVVDIVQIGNKMATVNVNGILYEVELEQKSKLVKVPADSRKDFVPSTDTPPHTVRTEKSENGNTIIRSPLPGRVIDIMVKEGEMVSIGQTVVCIEAMKMENNIRTDKEGIVRNLNVQINDAVMDGNVLLEIE